jgi:hypothetical protein
MNKFVSQNQQHNHLIEARDEVYVFLKGSGIEGAGVGVGYSEDTQKPCLFIHLEKPLPPELNQKLQHYWPGTEVEVVGRAIAYLE